MSISAHRVTIMETTGEVFNLYHDDNIVKWLKDHTSFFYYLNDDWCGISEMAVDDLRRMLQEVEIDENTKKAIEADIQWAEKHGEYYIKYYCY